MFEKEIKNIEEYNVLEEHHDSFKNELSINSYHVKYDDSDMYYGDMSIHKDIPLDVVYKSNPTKEVLYLTYAYDLFARGGGSPKYLRLRIDGRETIEMVIDEDDYISDSIFFYCNHHECNNRIYFEITKEQLHKLCLANSLAIQISNPTDSVMEEISANEFIAILQVLYNRAIDNTAFCDAKKRCISIFKDQVAAEKARDEAWKKECALLEKEERNKTVIWVIVIIVILLAFFLSLYFYVKSTTPPRLSY